MKSEREHPKAQKVTSNQNLIVLNGAMRSCAGSNCRNKNALREARDKTAKKI